MAPDDFSAYLLAVDVIDSRQVLRNCTSADWPNMKPKDRGNLYKKLQKAASPIKDKNKSPVSTEDFAKIMGVKSNVK